MEIKLENIKLEEIRKLVLNGGGAKGAGLVAAFAALIQCGLNPLHLDALAGASIGSIIVSLIACGYSVDELFEAMKDLNFLELLDEDGFSTRGKVVKTVDKLQAGKPTAFAVIPALSKAPTLKSRIAKDTGIYRGEELRKWIERKIYEKTGIEYCTFGELRALAKKDPRFKELFVVVTNDNTKVSEILGRHNSDDYIISDSDRASSAIPGFFESHHLYKKVEGKRVKVSEDLYNDGGIIDNYPISCFDTQPNGDVIFNREVIGLYLCESAVAKYLKGEGPLPHEEVKKGFINFAKTIAGIAFDKQYSDFVNSAKDKTRTIPIDNMGVSTFDFNIQQNPEAYNALLESGWKDTCQYFGQKHPFPEAYRMVDTYATEETVGVIL